MPAPKGNDFAKKWKTPEERQAVCERFCLHIGKGFSMDCFPDASAKTIRHYVKAYPDDFPPEKLEEAARRGLLWWERLGRAGAAGKISHFNATAWIFNMKNRAGWRDKSDIQADFSPPQEEGGGTGKVKPRSTGEIALSMMALLTQAEYEGRNATDGNGSGADSGED